MIFFIRLELYNYTAKEVCATLELNATGTAAEDNYLTNVTESDTEDTNVTNRTKQGGGKSMLSMHA